MHTPNEEKIHDTPQDSLGPVSLKPSPTRVVLCWHMHQPSYQNPANGRYQQPWVYLHGIKDYVDMAAIIEADPGARAVVNFSPLLLEQIDDYVNQIDAYFSEGSVPRDDLLTQLIAEQIPVENEQRAGIIEKCLRANEERLIKRFPDYLRLAGLANQAMKDWSYLSYLNDQYFHDLIMWYHIAWFGETVRRDSDLLTHLMRQGSRYSLEDRKQLLKLIGEQLGTIIPRYRKLADQNKIELSVTPYSHPILPLMIDMESGRDAKHDILLPEFSYPGGDARACQQLEWAIESFQNFFGVKPVGCWPSEGGVSDATLGQLVNAGFKWTASGEGVLHHSLTESDHPPQDCIHHPYRVGEYNIDCFFRDDNLSDMIGFNYSKWHANDAVANLIHNLEQIHKACEADPNKVVSIILDGENCWEHYPDNGYHFLTALYQALDEHPDLHPSTFSECLRDDMKKAAIKQLKAGSWVYGSFTTWIGDPDKNRAWDLLCNAKLQVDKILNKQTGDQTKTREIEKQLAICEASDWFWWFGDYNSAEAVRDFDLLYRNHLRHLYCLLEVPPPRELDEPLSVGRGDPEGGGAMRRGNEIT
ncbi:MAG: glycoside hydrolase family 57 protein [Pseudomonadales bacterium]|nr:glycoside hydrolase family 57 protein [Pseudomonadales bacterium]